jgi:tight adherence protein B
MDLLVTLLGGPDTALLIFAVGTMLTIFAAGYYLIAGDERRAGRSTRKQLQAVQGRWGSGIQQARAATLRLKGEDSGIASLDRVVRAFLPQRQALIERLSRTGKRITVAQYVLACGVVAAAAAFALYTFAGLPLVVALLGGIALGALLPHVYVGMLAKRRIKTFLANFPEAIDLMVRTVRSGLPITEGLTIVGQEMSGVIGEEFSRLEHAVKIGSSLDEALWDAAKRLDCPEFKFFVISLSVQRETGGNLAETLENLSDILRRRRQMLLKIKALSAEARASAMIIGLLPFIMFGILAMMSPGYVGHLLTDPRGQMMMAVGLTSIGLGVLVMAKMIRFEI